MYNKYVKMVKVAFIGDRRTGKSTAVNFINDTYGFEILSRRNRPLEAFTGSIDTSEGIKSYEGSKGAIIDDIRDLREYVWAVDNDFTIVRIDSDRSSSCTYKDNFSDACEVNLVIDNDGSKYEFNDVIQDFIEEEIWLNTGTDEPIPEDILDNIRRYLDDYKK